MNLTKQEQNEKHWSRRFQKLRELRRYTNICRLAHTKIDYFTVTKDGALEFDDRADNEEIETLLKQLAERGFTAAEMSDAAAEKVSKDAVAEPQGESVGLTVTIPLDKVAVGNLTKLLDAKGSLIKKALGIAELPIEIGEDAVPSLGSIPAWMRILRKPIPTSLPHCAG